MLDAAIKGDNEKQKAIQKNPLTTLPKKNKPNPTFKVI